MNAMRTFNTRIIALHPRIPPGAYAHSPGGFIAYRRSAGRGVS